MYHGTFLFFMISYICTATVAATDIETTADRAESQIDRVQDMVVLMHNDVFTQHLLGSGGNGISGKLETAKGKWRKAKQSAIDSYNADKEGNAERIGGAIEGVGSGLVEFVGGIKNGDWMQGVQGAISIISSIAQLAGPAGMILSSVLSFVSSIFSLFGGSTQSESMDDKIERIVKEQIDIGREKDLQADVEGMKVTYQSLSASIQHFRESKKMGQEQANELYNHAFIELPIFGKLKARVNDICDDKTEKKDSDKCLGVFKLYAEISVIRQLIITDMATLLAEVHENHHPNQSQSEVTEAENGGSGLLLVSNNLLNLIKKEQENDRSFLTFMGDPFNHRQRRHTLDIYFQNPDKFASLKAYIKTLHKSVPGGLFKDYVMICDDKYLKGQCNILSQGEYPNLNDKPGVWNNRILSVYIPLGLELTSWTGQNFAGSRNFGPYAGPLALGLIPGEKDWESIKIATTERDAENEVRICRTYSMEPEYCDTVPLGEYDLNNIHGWNWRGKLKSMYIPPGFTVHANQAPYQTGKRYLYITGPQTINKVFEGTTWANMEVSDQIAWSATEMLIFCDDFNLGGHCGNTWSNIRKIGRIRSDDDFSTTIKSLKIPGGHRVMGHSGENYTGATFGPYVGPSTIGKIDDSNRWRSVQFITMSTKKTGKKSKNRRGKESH